MSIKYKPDRKGVRAFGESRGIQNGMVSAAEVVKSAAESIPPPKIRSAAVRRAYSQSFKVVPTMAKLNGGGRTTEPRGAAMVINDHELEHVLGGRGRILYRAIDALKGVHIR